MILNKKELTEQELNINQLPLGAQNYIASHLALSSLSFLGMKRNQSQLVINLLKQWQSKLLSIKLTAGYCSLFLHTSEELYVCD